MRPGFQPDMTSGPIPSRSSVPRTNDSITTSKRGISRFSSDIPSGDFRLRVMYRLLRAYTFHQSGSPPAVHWRSGSPPPGCSTLTTSAPKSASSMPATPPAIMRDMSSTRTPASGVTIGAPSRGRPTCMDNYTRSGHGRGPSGMLTRRESCPCGAFPPDPRVRRTALSANSTSDPSPDCERRVPAWIADSFGKRILPRAERQPRHVALCPSRARAGLLRDRMLVKIHGKGTFVADEPPTLLAPVKYTGFLDDLQERIVKLRVAAVEMHRVPASPELIATLRLGDGVEVMRIRRLRHVDNEPFSWTVNYLPLEIGSRIRERALHTVPLLRILQDELKIPIVHARETIEAAPADPEVAQQLAIPSLYPVLHMKRVMYTTGDRPFELVEIYYRADKYHYSVNLVRVKRKGRWSWTTEVETSA